MLVFFNFLSSPPFRHGYVSPCLLIFLYFDVSLYRDACPSPYFCASPFVYPRYVCDPCRYAFDASHALPLQHHSFFSSPKFPHELVH